jgi:hypothetical protein
MLLPDIRKEYRYANCALACLLLALAVVPLFANMYGASTGGTRAFPFPTCAVLQHTGKLCAGCGLTRSVLAFYKGEFALSHVWHPAGSVLVTLIFLELVLRVLFLAKESAWLPWLDIGQLLLMGVLFRHVLISYGPLWGSPYGP